MLNTYPNSSTTANQQEIITENRRLAQELKQRLFELSILYELSNAISYTLNYDELIHLLVDSLHSVVDYDFCASLLVVGEGENPQVSIRTTFKPEQSFLEEIKNNLIGKFNTLARHKVNLEQEGWKLKTETVGSRTVKEQKVKSSFDVPLFVRDEVVGVLNVGSLRELEYPEETIKLLYTIASQASGAIERLQAVISAEKSKMKAMVESMSEGVIMTDEKNELTILNLTGREMLNFSRNEQLDATKVTQRLEEMGFFTSRQIIEEEERKGTVKEISLTKPYQRIVRVEKTTVRDKENKNLGTLLILRDVTREREVDQMKSEFVSMVSHELRTPLTAMRMAVDNLLDGVTGEPNERQKSSLLIIHRNIDRLSRLIEDLLDISRIEAGKIELKKRKTNLTQLVKDVVLFLNQSASKKDVDLFADLNPDLPEINVDQDKITQVLTNLIGNAIKFTPEKGKIIVSSKMVEKGVQVDILDSGTGIPAYDLGKIFDKFYRVSHSGGKKTEGTGLGLSICKGIIQKHNGKIWAESELGKGSKFSFVLPLE